MNQSFIKSLFGGTDPTNFDLQTVEHLLTIARQTLAIVAAFVAVFGLILVGYQYLTAYGDEAKATQAKKSLYWIVIGMIIIILSDIAVYEIQRTIVDPGLAPGQVPTVTAPITTPPVIQPLGPTNGH